MSFFFMFCSFDADFIFTLVYLSHFCTTVSKGAGIDAHLVVLFDYHCIGQSRSPLSIKTKSLQLFKALSNISTSLSTFGLKIFDFREKQVKIQNFAIIDLNIRISQGLLLTNRCNGDSKICCTGQLRNMQIFFFQNGNIIFSGVATTLLLPNFDGLPYLQLWGYLRNVFIKMTAKDKLEFLCSRKKNT